MVPKLKYTLPRMMLAVVCFGCSLHATAALTLQVRVATHYGSGKNVSIKQEDKTEDEQIVIGENYVSVKAGSSLSVFDFSTRRRYAIDLPSGRYTDYSLFDTVGFRVTEMQNRQGLARMAAAAKLALASNDVVYNEQSLAVLAGAGEQLGETVEGGERVLAIDGKTLLRRSTAGTPVSAADAAGFVRFLRYTAGGHPLVLDKLASARDVPQQLTFSYGEVGGVVTRRYEILAITPSAPASYDLTPYAKGSSATDEVDMLLDRADTLQSPARAGAREAMQHQMAMAFAESRPLDAMLGVVEWNLMTGEPIQPFTPEQKAQLQGDASVQQLSKVMAAHDKASFAAAIPVLQQVQQHTMTYRHMLTLLEANDRMKLGQLDAARPMFVRVLNVNPSLAGAYKDLGDLQFRQFDMSRAWRCWDAGRHMAPALGLFASVTQFERTLLQQHPEYF